MTHQYNSQYYRIQTNLPETQVIRYTPNGFGDVEFQDNPGLNDITRVFDQRRRLISETNGAGDQTSYEYDLNNNRTAVIKPDGTRWEYSYDAANRLTSIKNTVELIETIYAYDNKDNLVSITDAMGKETTFGYDNRNRKLSKIYADGQDVNYSYDENGNIKTVDLPNGVDISYDYDVLNRKTNESYRGTYGTADVTFTLDANGNPETITENIDGSIFTINQGFDNLDRLVSRDDVYGNNFIFSYDNNGNRKTFKDHNNNLTNYTYDDLNRLDTLTFAGLGSFNWSYNNAGLTDSIDYPNGASVEYDYDSANRIESILNKRSGANITSHLYQYDANGNRLKLTESNVNIDQEINYIYDKADRLTSVIYPNQTTVYQLDKVGNRETETLTGTVNLTKTYSYNNRDQLTDINDDLASNISYTFDNAGNQLTKDDNGAITTFDYTARHRVKSITVGAGNPINYQYDYTGQRVNHQTNGQEKRYLYDGLTLIAQTNTIGNTIARYHYGDRYQLAEQRNSVNSYYHVDSLGTNVAVTNQDGSIQARYEYDAYGNLLTQAGSSETPFRYTGHQFDEETGLYYANARYYDSNTGRFLREDPQEGNTSQPPSLHRYLYAHVNPNFYTDPTGEAAYAFDGTGQDRNTGSNTNVNRLFDLYSGIKFYKSGVGTNESNFVKTTAGKISGFGGDKRLNEMYVDLVNTYNGVSKGKNGEVISFEADREIDLIGFSRGAALARSFANMINEKGIPDLSSARTVKRNINGQPIEYTVYDNYFKPEIRSMSLFDTVGSFGLAGNQDDGNKNLSIPPNVQNVFHATARDETRSGFPLSSVIDPDNPNDPRIRERSFEGSHSDIGCCYADDESLSYDPLYWIWNELDALNVPIDSLPPEYMPIAPHEAVADKRKWIPYANSYINIPQQGGRKVHDSRYIKSNKFDESPREIFYYNNPSSNNPTSKKKAFAPKRAEEHERLLQEIYKKNYEVVTENPNAPQ